MRTPRPPPTVRRAPRTRSPGPRRHIPTSEPRADRWHWSSSDPEIHGSYRESRGRHLPPRWIAVGSISETVARSYQRPETSVNDPPFKTDSGIRQAGDCVIPDAATREFGPRRGGLISCTNQGSGFVSEHSLRDCAGNTVQSARSRWAASQSRRAAPCVQNAPANSGPHFPEGAEAAGDRGSRGTVGRLIVASQTAQFVSFDPRERGATGETAVSMSRLRNSGASLPGGRGTDFVPSTAEISFSRSPTRLEFCAIERDQIKNRLGVP